MNSRQRIKVLKMYGCYIKGNKYSKDFFESLLISFKANLRQMMSSAYSYRDWKRKVAKRRKRFEDNYRAY